MFTTRKDTFDRLFDEALVDMLSTFKPKYESMAIKDDELNMEFEVPGFSKEDFKITVEDLNLIIEGSTKSKKFNKSYKINEGWDVSKTSAEVRNGILTITIPKKETKKSKLIEVTIN